ncbi:unnamed protein product, partial [marine sediment metagenome]
MDFESDEFKKSMKEFTKRVERTEKFGGDISFNSYKSFEEVYLKGEVHPMDLKSAVTKSLGD